MHIYAHWVGRASCGGRRLRQRREHLGGNAEGACVPARPSDVLPGTQVYSKRARQRSSELATKLLISNIGKQGCRPVSSARPPFLDRAGQEQPLGGRRATGSDSNDATARKAAHLRSRRAAEAAIASSGQMARCFTARSESVVSHPFGTRSTPSRSEGAVP